MGEARRQQQQLRASLVTAVGTVGDTISAVDVHQGVENSEGVLASETQELAPWGELGERDEGEEVTCIPDTPPSQYPTGLTQLLAAVPTQTAGQGTQGGEGWTEVEAAYAEAIVKAIQELEAGGGKTEGLVYTEIRVPQEVLASVPPLAGATSPLPAPVTTPLVSEVPQTLATWESEALYLVCFPFSPPRCPFLSLFWTRAPSRPSSPTSSSTGGSSNVASGRSSRPPASQPGSASPDPPPPR